MKKIIYKLAIVSLSMLTISCLDNNKNPYEPDDLSADDYALGAAMSRLASTVVSTDVNTAQFTDALLGGPMGGYYADANAGWAFTISNYNPTDDWTRVFLVSDQVIPVLNANMKSVEIVARDTDNPVPLAIAKIIKVTAMQRITDTYGPIPYTQLGLGDNMAIAYDSQEEVYNAMFKDLDESIKILNDNPSALLVPTADYVYRGQTRQWVKFANSMKLRLAMRIVYADKAKAQKMAEEAIDPANGGVIEQNADNAAWHYFSASNVNTVYTATRYNSEGAKNGGDTHAAADIICYMNGYKDNRREHYFNASEWPNTDYVGLRRGIIIPDHKSIGYQYSGVKISPSSPALWLNAAEVSFLRAEATAVFGFNMGGSAQDFYENGIRLSFAQWGADGVEAYLNDATSVPTNYIDPNEGKNTYQAALTDIKIKWDDNASPEQKQERIITQKWISNWQIGHEAWSDYRRTGYPKLIPASDAGNKSGGLVDSKKGARRMPYPLDEYNTNADNIKEAVTKYLKGADNMATKVWWDAKIQ